MMRNTALKGKFFRKLNMADANNARLTSRSQQRHNASLSRPSNQETSGDNRMNEGNLTADMSSIQAYTMRDCSVKKSRNAPLLDTFKIPKSQAMKQRLPPVITYQDLSKKSKRFKDFTHTQGSFALKQQPKTLQGCKMQAAQFKTLFASRFMKFNSKKMALLFSIQVPLKDRDPVTRADVVYPYRREIKETNEKEDFVEPPKFEITFFYQRLKRTMPPSFTIFAIRVDKLEEQYQIEMYGEHKIKFIMKQFGHEYMGIVDNLRIMEDALVLLNPSKRTSSIKEEAVADNINPVLENTMETQPGLQTPEMGTTILTEDPSLKIGTGMLINENPDKELPKIEQQQAMGA